METGKTSYLPTSSHNLPNASQQFKPLWANLAGKALGIFLDYDGTLTPIANHPEEAILDPTMRKVLSQLSQQVKVIIISGRDKANVQQLVGLPNLLYAGNHGLDMEGFFHPKLIQTMPILHKIHQALLRKLAIFPGVQLEPKNYTLAIHYRNAAIPDINKIIASIQNTLEAYADLKQIYGKQVVDICPDIAWDKGKALNGIISTLTATPTNFSAIYIGDDLTDENAFRALTDKDVGILVGDHGEKTYANYGLANSKAVEGFLCQLIEAMKNN